MECMVPVDRRNSSHISSRVSGEETVTESTDYCIYRYVVHSRHSGTPWCID